MSEAHDLSFALPERLIAQEPARRRGGSRLLLLRRDAGTLEDLWFRDLPGLLARGDLVVANHSAVWRGGRLFGRRDTGGRVECLLLERIARDGKGPAPRRERWSCLLRPARRLRPGEPIRFGPGLAGLARERRGPLWFVDLESRGDPTREIARLGRTPLPPYIRRNPGDPRERTDRARYRTVYQDQPGSAAAPTAGLHFTPGIRRRLRSGGIGWAPLRLHLGPASFLPVRPDDPDRVRLPAERYRLPAATARRVEGVRRAGGRVLAVGTSTVRVLETCRDGEGRLRPGSGECRLFVRPGFGFGAVNALLTNFHLPGSTHLLLVGAFAGSDLIRDAYRHAIRVGYRFYSYGDAMLIL